MENTKPTDPDDTIVRNILHAIEQDSTISQRQLATSLGIALGSVNWHLKRCINKGLIKVNQAPLRRYLYYLTPRGFDEKSKLTASYLRHSLTLFRTGRRESGDILKKCEANGWLNIALAGVSDLAEIFILSAHESPVRIVEIVDSTYKHTSFCGLPVSKRTQAQALILTDMSNPAEALRNARQYNKPVFIPPLLGTLPD